MSLRQFITLREAIDNKDTMLGRSVNGFTVTEKTPDEPWQGNYDVAHEDISSLKYSPKHLRMRFSCSYNARLTTLEGGPERVEGGYFCSATSLRSFVGAPKYVGRVFWSEKMEFLTSLEGLPTEIGDKLIINSRQLTSLRNIHKFVKRIGFKQSATDGYIYFGRTPIKSHALGLLLIDGAMNVESTDPTFQKVTKIINKYLPNTRGMAAVNECQDELIEADLEDFAEL